MLMQLQIPKQTHYIPDEVLRIIKCKGPRYDSQPLQLLQRPYAFSLCLKFGQSDFDFVLYSCTLSSVVRSSKLTPEFLLNAIGAIVTSCYRHFISQDFVLHFYYFPCHSIVSFIIMISVHAVLFPLKKGYPFVKCADNPILHIRIEHLFLGPLMELIRTLNGIPNEK